MCGVIGAKDLENKTFSWKSVFVCPEVGWEFIKCSKGEFMVKCLIKVTFTQPLDAQLVGQSISIGAHLVSKHFNWKNEKTPMSGKVDVQLWNFDYKRWLN